MTTLNLNEVIITIQDARKHQNGCVNGWQMFVEQHGYNFKEVVKNGLTAQQLIDTEDALAIKLVDDVLTERGLING